MAAPFLISQSPAGMLAAMACVIAGGPWFADGLRALRLRRLLGSLARRPDEALRPGFGLARGRVALDRPLVAPLSGRPCAGFDLEVRAENAAHASRVQERRAFRLVTPDGDVAVDAPAARWDLAAGLELRVGSPDELSETVSRLLERSPELRWLKARGGPLLLSERALAAGTEACVVGERVLAADSQVIAEPELARTGTDDRPVSISREAGAPAAWAIRPSGELELCVVCDRTPSPARLAPPAWRLLGVALGPALALLGLLVLADAAAPYVSRGY